MKIYIDMILLLNFFFDFLLLLGVSIILRRHVEITRLMLGAFIGSLSILFLFIKITSLELFLIKIVISFLMIIIAFSFKNIRYTLKNMFYLYVLSVLLGGFLYFLNIEFSYKKEGIVFYNNGLSINIIFLVILSPVIIYIYIKQVLALKNNYSHYYKVSICLENDLLINCTGYLDTGNKLVDPYKKRPVLLINKDLLSDIHDEKAILVPYNALNYSGLIRCLKVKKIWIDEKVVNSSILLGIMEEKIKIDGVDCILNEKILEG